MTKLQLAAGVMAGAVFLAMAGGASAADEVDNPAYLAWAQFKPGTSVTHQLTKMMDVMPPGMVMPGMITVTKLVSVAPDKVVVEVTVSVSSHGQVTTLPARSQEIPAKVAKDEAYAPNRQPGQKVTVSDVKKGTEKIEVHGKTLDAVTIEATVKSPGNRGEITTHTKTWTNATIPGGMVKMESTAAVPGPGNAAPNHVHTETQLVDYTIEK